MSQENVEIVKRANECLERRDWPGIADLMDPNVELHGSVGGLEQGNILRGLGEISQAIDTEDRDVWDEHRIEPREFIDAGDRVVVLHREYQRGKGSGVETVVDTASILDVRDGRIVRMQGYMNPADALEAAGLFPPSAQVERFSDLAREIEQSPSSGETRLVGVDGCGGAGKSTFADQLSKHLGDASVIHTDDFASWDDPIDWWPRMKEQVIDPLAQGNEARWQRYDWEQRDLAEWHTLEPGGVVIIEGVTAARREWRDQLAYSVWVDCPRKIRLRRGLERDGQEALPLWERWMAAEDKYIADQSPQAHTNLLVSGAPEQSLDEGEYLRLS